MAIKKENCKLGLNDRVKNMQSIQLSENELNLLRFLRKSAHRENLHKIANSIGLKFDCAKNIISKLQELGYIQQDKRDEINGFEHGYTYFTCPGKRAEIDELLLLDLESSVVKVEDIDCINAGIDDRTYICLECITAYKTSIRVCKNCLNGVVEIDSNILDIIVELNRKGYKTKHCCSGHISNLASAAYIVMDSNTDFVIIPEGFIKEVKNGTTILRAERLIKRLNKKSNAVLTDEDNIKITDFIKSDMQKLREWVKELSVKC